MDGKLHEHSELNAEHFINEKVAQTTYGYFKALLTACRTNYTTSQPPPKRYE